MEKKDREYIFYGLTRSICPKCKEVIDAQILVKDNKVYMKKRCAEHGEFMGMISSDFEMYSKSLSYNKPGTMPMEFATSIKKGCPHDCGLCPDHQQHTCIGVVEITDSCNLNCPVCYANVHGNSFLTKKEVERIIDQYVRSEENPQVIQFTGGEPTLHPELFELLKIAKSKDIKMIMLNTNGIKIAEDEEFVKKLSKHDIIVYLQFDGFKKETYEKIRGKDMREIKKKAIENLEKYNIPLILVQTTVKGINDNEIGEIVKFAIKNPLIQGIVFQPAVFTGRFPAFDPMDRTTTPDVIKAINDQTEGMFIPEDFIPLPCSYPLCCSLIYAYRKDNEVIPITRKIKLDDYVDYFKNQIIEGEKKSIRKSIENLYSASATLGFSRVIKDFYSVFGIPKISEIPNLKKNIFKIIVKSFMDEYTFDQQRVMKCCVHTIRPDGKMVPFCVNNILYRKKGVNRE